MARHQGLAVKDGVNTSRHSEALRTSSFLTLTFQQMYQRKAAMITPGQVIAVLNQAGVRFVLMGAHGVGGWMGEPRSTQDVDVLVPKSEHRKAIQALHQGFDTFTIQDTPVVTRFIDPGIGKVVIDVMKPSAPILRATFRNTVRVEDSHDVPNLEMALAAKFAAMVSPNRDDRKKHLDVADFIDIVRTNSKAIKRTKLRGFGDKVYPGGGKELLQMVDDVIARKPFQV